MTNGALWDLYAFAFAAAAGVLSWLAVKVWHRGTRPHDWAKDWPEYSHSKETHVRRID